jgi:putative Mg2+ transporter-C (MgtC) family protein
VLLERARGNEHDEVTTDGFDFLPGHIGKLHGLKYDVQQSRRPIRPKCVDALRRDPQAMLTLSICGKCLLGLILGGLIGYERERGGRPAGIRTHMLLVLGVVLFGEASRNFGIPNDTRIAAQIVTGVGFLGAGVIFRTGTDIKGVTTAASVWSTAGIGLAISAGGPMLIVAVLATLAVLLTLSFVEKLEYKLNLKNPDREVQIALTSRDDLGHFLEFLDREKVTVLGLHIVNSSPGFTFAFRLADPPKAFVEGVLRAPGVISAEWL